MPHPHITLPDGSSVPAESVREITPIAPDPVDPAYVVHLSSGDRLTVYRSGLGWEASHGDLLRSRQSLVRQLLA